MKNACRLLLICSLFCLPTALRAEGEEGKAPDYLEDRIVSDVLVIADRPEPLVDTLDHEDFEAPRFSNVGEALAELPGVDAVRRAASATEPVLRGLGWERVATEINGMPAYGACPSRMDPPITYVKPNAARKAQVIKGLPSVTLGPGGTAGRILVSTDYERDPEAEAGIGGWTRLAGDSARGGILGSAGFEGGNRHVDYSGSFEISDYGDYDAPDGTMVPATQKGWNAIGTLAWRPGGDDRWWNTLNFIKESEADFPALPMDMADSEVWFFSTGYRKGFSGGWLDELDVSLGFQDIDHVMNNFMRPSSAMMRNQAVTESDVLSGRAGFSWELAERRYVKAGVDSFGLARDGTRTRYMVMMDRTFEDRIWPDATQRDLGAFVEAGSNMGEDWTIRFGARFDSVHSDARAADEPSLRGMTVREAYAFYYGPDAADVKRSEDLFSGNLHFEWQPTGEQTVHFGFGRTTRPAGVTERYFAFAPAPGGFLVGNPTLEAEKKNEVEAAYAYEGNHFAVRAAVFYDWFDDYILQTAIDQDDINGDTVPDTIKGFENIEARLYGGEVAGIVDMAGGWSVPFSLACVVGENRTDGGWLPEIPPLKARLAVHYEAAGGLPWWVELGALLADTQDKIDPDFPENETPGYTVMHLRGGITVAERWTVLAGIENLLDRQYNDHLTREAFQAVGDLKPGQEIPAPERSFVVSVRATF